MLARVAPLQRLLVGSLVVAGCAYQPDTFSYAREPFKGVYLSVQCLDLAISHRRESAHDVIAYQFGNRCDQPALVDLAAAHVTGDTGDGDVIDLYAFDPMREVRALLLDARAVGREAIEYPSGTPLQNVCVDAASVAHVTPPSWICFRD